MKKTIILVLLCFLFSISRLAYAHSPQKIEIKYYANTKMLQAVIFHDVSSRPEGHFIRTVILWLHGKEMLRHVLSAQDNNISQTVTYLLPDLKKGDTITFEADCSINGRLYKEIIIK